MSGPPPTGPALNALLLERMAELGIRNQTRATILDPKREPCRMEKYRAEAEWLAAAMELIPHRPIHVRGLHYAALGTTKPNGSVYTKHSRERRVARDQAGECGALARPRPVGGHRRSEERRADGGVWTPPEPRPVIRVGQVEILLPEDLTPEADLEDFRPVQPYKLALFAEKTAVGDVVRPLAERYQVDLYLETGEISNTHLFQMARIGAEDGRPMVVFTLTDADPAGYWMPATSAWKLGAFRDGWFPDLEFELQPIGFLHEQVIAINEQGEPLPSSPLKADEKRAGAWEQTWGIGQVELDAIATLRPDVLERIVRGGIRPFFDSSPT